MPCYKSFMAYLPPTPALHSVLFHLNLAADPEVPASVVVHAQGRSVYRRGNLWAESSIFAPGDDQQIAPADWLHHIALVALQDRPNTQERLLFGLTGGLGVQEELF